MEGWILIGRVMAAVGIGEDMMVVRVLEDGLAVVAVIMDLEVEEEMVVVVAVGCKSHEYCQSWVTHLEAKKMPT